MVVNHRLADVEDVDVVFGQHLCQGGCQAGMVLTGNIEQDDFAHGV